MHNKHQQPKPLQKAAHSMNWPFYFKSFYTTCLKSLGYGSDIYMKCNNKEYFCANAYSISDNMLFKCLLNNRRPKNFGTGINTIITEIITPSCCNLNKNVPVQVRSNTDRLFARSRGFHEFSKAGLSMARRQRVRTTTTQLCVLAMKNS